MTATASGPWTRQPTPPVGTPSLSARNSGLFARPPATWTPRDRVRRAMAMLRRQQTLTHDVARATDLDQMAPPFAEGSDVWRAAYAEAEGVFGRAATQWIAYAVVNHEDIVVAYVLLASGVDGQKLAIGYGVDGLRLVAEQVSAVDED